MRIKNFLKILPTYETLWKREVWGIPNMKCPRCKIEKETWDYVWSCSKNDTNTEFYLLKESTSEVLTKIRLGVISLTKF